jgi:predicted Zn-dependent protease
LVFVTAATAFSYQAPPTSYPQLSVANQRVRIGKAKQRAAALPALVAAAAAEPWNPEWLMELAGVLRNLGRIPEAMAAYEKILRANPTHFAARWELASTLVEQGWLDETIGHLRVLTRQSPANASAHYFLGRFLSRIAARSEPAAARIYEEEAGLHLQAALRLDAAHAPSWYEIGRRRHLRGDTQGAVEALNRAVRIAPGLGEAVRLLNIINARKVGMVDGFIPRQGAGAASRLITWKDG